MNHHPTSEKKLMQFTDNHFKNAIYLIALFFVCQNPFNSKAQCAHCLTANMSIGTGYDHENNIFYNQGAQDQYWYLTNGPATYTYPMCAISQGQGNQGFVSANSTRISVNFNSVADGNMVGNVNNCTFNDDPYRFQRDFCVNTGPGNPTVDGNLSIATFIGDLNVSDIRLFGPGLGGGGLALSTTCWPQAVQTISNTWNPIPFSTGTYTLRVEIGNDWANTGSGLFPNWNGPTAMSLQMAVGLNSASAIFTDNSHFGKRVGLCAPTYAPDVFFNLTGITCIPPAGSTTISITPFNNAVGENIYSVTGPGSPTINGGGLFTAVVGTYTVTSTDAKGCSYTTTIEIFSNTVNPPVLTLAPANACIAPGGSAVTFDGVSNGVPGFSYSTSSPNLTYGIVLPPVISGFETSIPGFYTVTVTDAHGCTGTATFTVGNIFPLTLSGPSGGPPCLPLGGSTQIFASVPGWVTMGTYQLNGGAAQVSNQFTVNSIGTYTVTATDAYGCSTTSTINVTASPVVSITSNNVPCGEELTALPTTGMTYLWNADPVPQNPYPMPYQYPPTSITYTVVGTDAVGCTGTSIFNWVQNPFCCGILDPLLGDHFSTSPLYNNGTASAIIAVFGNPVTTTNTILLDGSSFSIDQDITFLNCPNVKITGNTLLNIKPGKNLTITNSTFQANCNYLWRGIKASGSTSKVTITNSTIRDMEDGVRLLNSAKIESQGSNFLNNYISMQLENAVAPYNLGGGTGNCVILNNYFGHVGTGNLLYPYTLQTKGEMGIVVKDCQEVAIGEMTAGPFSNTFDNLYNGINIESQSVAQTENYYIYSNEFKNIYNGDNTSMSTIYSKLGGWAIGTNRRGAAIFGMKPASTIPNHTAYISYGGDNNNASFYKCDRAVVLHSISADISWARTEACLMGLMMNRADGQKFYFDHNALISEPSVWSIDFLWRGILISGNNGTSTLSWNSIKTAPVECQTTFPIGIGVLHPNAANTSMLTINNNNLQHYCPTGAGLYMYNVQQACIVDRNGIDLNNTSGPATPSPIAAGIYAEKSHYTQFLGNVVAGNMTLLGTGDYFDAMRMKSSLDCELLCNLFSYTRYGVRVVGDNSTGPTLVKGNSHIGHGRGWYFEDLGTFDATLGTNIGSPSDDNGNLFFSADLLGSGWGIYRDGSNPFFGVIWTSLFGGSYSSAIGGFAMYSVNIPGVSPYECDYSIYTPPIWWKAAMGIDEEDGLKIIADSLNQIYLAESKQWVDRQELMYALERDDSLRNSNDTLSNYYAAQSESNIGMLAKINEQFAALYDSAIVYDSTTYVQKLTDIENLNNSFTATALPELYAQIMNRYVLKYMNGGIESLNEDETDTLQIIANLCPVLWGNAVYQARTLYGNIEILSYDDQNICSSGLNKTGAFDKGEIDLSLLRAMQQSGIKIYPNPFDNQITIDYSLKQKEKGAFIIYDITGVEKFSIELSPTVNRASINVNNMPKGLYIYKYLVNNTMRDSGKLLKE